MKYLIHVFGMVLLLNSTSAQKYDNIWILGYHFWPNGPIAALDFYNNQPDSAGFYTPIDFFGCNASICDSSGHLLLYTNGAKVLNKFHQYLEGSDSFNHEGVLGEYDYTYWNYLQSAIILPFPNHQNQFYIFHLNGDYFNNYNEFQPLRVEYSTVDMSLNSGEGEMTTLNQVAIDDTVLYGNMQAVKHCNGRDWWLAVHSWKSKQFDLALLTPDDIEQVFTQTVGPKFKNGIYIGQSVFSPDGSQYAMTAYDSNGVYLFNFDRCSGAFTYITNLSINDSVDYSRGCSFSPNGEYLYVSSLMKLYQFDTYAPDIAASKILIAEYDGYGDPFATLFYRHRLAPDGKIYISTWNGCKHMHVINNPDLQGTSCDFMQHQLQLISYNAGVLPEYPNYDLGKFEGSGCDTIATSTSLVRDDDMVEIFPAPARDNLFVRFGKKISSVTSLKIFDVQGKLCLNSAIENGPAATNHRINVSNLSPGFYRIEIITENKTIVRSLIIQ